MIFDKIFRAIGYVKKYDYEKLKNERNIFRGRLCQEEKKNDVLVAERAKAAEDIFALQQKYEYIESKNECLKDEVWDLKSRLADEIQKRVELAEKLEECEADRNNWEFRAIDYKQHLDHLEIGLNLADLFKQEGPENEESVG